MTISLFWGYFGGHFCYYGNSKIWTRTHSMACHRKSPHSWSNLMVFDLLAPPQGHQLIIHINLICHMTMFRIFFWPQAPPSPPLPWGMTQATEWKSRLICFISFICEMTHKVWLYNSLKLTLKQKCNDIWPFGPSKRPHGAGTKRIVLFHLPFMWVTHTPIWLNFGQN